MNTLEEMEKCQGVSRGKAIKYARPFVELIAKYVKDNDIEKPDDFVIKSVANNANNKIYILQNVDKKITLETVSQLMNFWPEHQRLLLWQLLGTKQKRHF